MRITCKSNSNNSSSNRNYNNSLSNNSNNNNTNACQCIVQTVIFVLIISLLQKCLFTMMLCISSSRFSNNSNSTNYHNQSNHSSYQTIKSPTNLSHMVQCLPCRLKLISHLLCSKSSMTTQKIKYTLSSSHRWLRSSSSSLTITKALNKSDIMNDLRLQLKGKMILTRDSLSKKIRLLLLRISCS